MEKKERVTWPLKKRVEVLWRDSASQGGWNTPEGYRKKRHVGPCKSIGYLLEDSGRMLTLAQSQSGKGGDVSDCITIPREAVVRIRRVYGGLS